MKSCCGYACIFDIIVDFTHFTYFQTLVVLCFSFCNLQKITKKGRLKVGFFGVIWDCGRSKPFTVWLFFVPQPEPFMKVDSDKSNAARKCDTKQIFCCCKFQFVTRWIFPSTCGSGKFQIPSNFAKSSWSPGCGLNLCPHHHTITFSLGPKHPQLDLSDGSLPFHRRTNG